MVSVAMVCLLALSALGAGDNSAEMAVCLSVAREARRQHVPVVVAVSVAFEESRFRHLDTAYKGPLAVSSHWARQTGDCASRTSCDYIYVGVRWLAWMVDVHRGYQKALCHYNAGAVCTKRGKLYADRVLRRAWQWQAQLETLEQER